MNVVFQNDDRPMSEVLDNITSVSGSSIVLTSDYDLVIVRSVSDLSSVFNPLSSISFCLMIIAIYFYKKFLDLIKHIISALLGGVRKR